MPRPLVLAFAAATVVLTGPASAQTYAPHYAQAGHSPAPARYGYVSPSQMLCARPAPYRPTWCALPQPVRQIYAAAPAPAARFGQYAGRPTAYVPPRLSQTEELNFYARPCCRTWYPQHFDWMGESYVYRPRP